ncbi:MAG: hypothetical protein AAF548_01555 [Actinomycetota bacterium]
MTGRPVTRRWLASTAVVMLAVTAVSATMTSAAASVDRGLRPSAYPETGPTTTTTLPVAVDPSPYPTTAPTTTVPTTTVAPDPGTATPTTAPPTTAPAGQTTPEPTPEAEPEAEPDEELPAESTLRYGIGEEHRPISVDASWAGASSYALMGDHPGVSLTSDGTLHWTPTEADGDTIQTFMVIARTGDAAYTIEVRILVAEVESSPVVDERDPVVAYPGHTTQFRVTASDADVLDGDGIASWSIDGPAGMTIDDGLVVWAVPDDAGGDTVTVTVTAADDGDPPLTGSRTFTIDVLDDSEQALLAVDDAGEPVHPLVIAAASPESAPLLVDLEDPAALVVAMVERTPPAVASSTVANAPERGAAASTAERSAVVSSVRQTMGALLDLEVPTTAVASGIAWQFVLMAAPGLLSRRRDLFDVQGLAPDAMIGDGRWFFRSDAIALRGSGLRWKDGRWMRKVASPVGPVWLPAAHLASSRRTGRPSI